jgi:ligand-binding sensor domain-containing protein
MNAKHCFPILIAAAAVLGALALLGQSAPARAPSVQSGAPKWFHLGWNGDVRALSRIGGTLWVGTGGGLFVYDLHSENLLAHVTAGPFLPSSSVRAIAARGDSVFVGTDQGLAVFAGDTASVFTPASPGPFPAAALERIRHVDFGPDEKVFVSTYGRGLGVLEGEVGRMVTRTDSLLDNKVFGVVSSGDTTYCATSMGLCASRDSVWVSFQAGAGIPRAEVRQVVAARDGGLYLLVAGSGVHRFSGSRARRISYRTLFPENDISAMALDAEGDLWACGGHGGIAVYRDERWARVGEGDPRVDEKRWRSAYADSAFEAFFGSADGTVVVVRDQQVAELQVPAGLPSGTVTCLTQDSSGDVLALCGSFLVRIGSGRVGVENPLPAVAEMGVSPGGQLWVATRSNLYRREGNAYVEVFPQLGEREVMYTAIGFDSSGALWLGTHTGTAYRYDGEIWLRMADRGELGEGAPAVFATDGVGQVWLLGSDGGLSVFAGDRWTTFADSTFDGAPVRAIDVTPGGAIVAATDNAIWRQELEGRWGRWARGKGGKGRIEAWDPAPARIAAIAFDGTGRLFVGTDLGLAVVDDERTVWITRVDGLGGTAVECLFVEPAGAVWVGLRNDGLTRVPFDAIPSGS